ncbi:hypothetical protein LTR05_003309 [Lithohypha guttulata]|uniref:[histone H3]-trimethyl-L-lysine(9) demethylase n=1 Tax=Lithohypha guttulata TaxID=1690604 RepID=A0AAN7YD78_9EURO|nr:hypothetical protein LTR05_003309 [Lithohypha guttulata]
MAALQCNEPLSPSFSFSGNRIKHEFNPDVNSLPSPPTTNEGAEGSHKEDDAVSTSSLSDLDETVDLDMNMNDLDEQLNRQRFEDAARAGAEAEQHAKIKPHHYEGGVPVFQPTMEEFRDFQAFMAQADAYGMQSGIIKIVPPEEWKAARKALDDLVKHIKIKNPLTQEFHGAQGVYTQRNMEKIRSYNLPQWKAVCEQTENQPPAKRGEKRLNADKLLGRGTKKKTEGTPTPETGKRRGRPVKKRESTTEPDTSLVAPLTPTSPDLDSVKIKVEPAEDEADGEVKREETLGPAKRGRKPRGRQPRTTTKKEPGAGKSTETTVATRRLKNVGAASDVIDEEAFQDFDYRTYDHDQWTQERCDELEEKYWKSLNFSNPMYAADMPGSLFDQDTKEWNVAKLPNLLDLLGAPIPGVNTAYLYLGMWRATFAWHLEDVDLYSINYIHFGAPKQWYSISQKDAPKFEAAMKSIWPSDAKNCDQFLRHKTYLVSPSILKSKYGVQVNKVVHREGEFVITFPIGYHSGYNLGYNCAESVNFAIENWLEYGQTARKCQCEADSVFIDVDWFVRRMNGEPSPEFEEVEITDDEDDQDDGADRSTPASGRGKTAQKRKRSVKDLGPNKKAKKIVKIRKISKHQPCCLCPNDLAWEELLPTTNGLRAHRVCAMYTPETYIATKDGTEKVFNVENISKARLDLRCHECKQKKGSCFQCSSAKCTRAYHATCAMHAGVQVDKGEIAVWHEGIEYRDIGFDWRCKLHRTVKRTRITSDLSTLNHTTRWLANKELHEHIIGLVPGDVIQWQASHGDEIQAGLVKSAFDPGQNSILVSVLPDVKTIREIDPAWILFVDSSTSCLQRPTANALDLPEDLQGKTAQVPGSTEKKPSEGDPFTEEPKTEWAEFVVEPPPHNKWQKRTDLTKPKQIFYYLGATSTDTKAQYTADAFKPVYDPACNFLEKVEPSRMAPPPQPKRHSLAASYPMISNAARNATIQFVGQQIRQNVSPVPRATMGPKSDSILNAAREKALELERSGLPPKNPQYRDIMAAAEARANEQARILQRQQQAFQYSGPSQYSIPNNGIGIDQSAVARQKQFQQQASQQSRSMSTASQQGSPHHSPPLPLYTTNSPMTAYRPYHNVAPTYYSNENARYGMNGSFTPQSMQFTHDWMNPPGRSPTFPSPAMPTMESNSPELGFKQPATYTQSPTTMQSPPMVASNSPPQQSPIEQRNSFLGDSAVSRGTGGTSYTPSLKKEASSIESNRTSGSNLPPPRTPTEIERQRRISNPSWPFKSPEQIMAQKGEREKNGSQSSGSRPVSRPGSGYSTKAFPSPRIPPQYGPELQPPMYINPTATQLSSSAAPVSHNRAKSMSVSAGLGKMGPPAQYPAMPPFRRSMSSNNLTPMDGDIKRELAGLRQEFFNQTSTMLPTLGPHPMPPPSRSRRSTMNSAATPPTVVAPIAPPSPELQSTLESRPTTRSGTPTNDRPVPDTITSWHSHPGFWGKIAAYFTHKHDSAATIYKSPFGVLSNPDLATTVAGNEALGRMQGASTIGNDGGLAGRWLSDLEDSRRDFVESWKIDHPIGMRP